MAINPAVDFSNVLADFGSAATLGGAAVVGVLSEAPAVGLNVLSGSDPTFGLPEADLPADPRTVTLVVGARTFNVRDWSAEAGWATLQLEAA